MTNGADLSALLPLGVDDFAGLRAHGFVYVDKTALIHSFASRPKAKIFLTRPRRFGKSLLVSTLASLFSRGLRDFRGLAIEKLWKESVTYPVIRLDFSRIKSFENAGEFRSLLESQLRSAFAPLGFSYAPDSGIAVTEQLSGWLHSLPESSVVLLIDEYDAPLTACLGRPALFEEIRLVMQRFFAAVKSESAALRFFFMTGITKFHQTGIFSEFNNLEDISLSPAYSTLAGYTKEEIRRCFSPYVARAASVLSISEQEVLDGIEENYDGFCFDSLEGVPREPARVHAPWSVLNFLNNPLQGFRNYWVESGGQLTLLHQYLRSHTLQDPREYITEKTISAGKLSASTDIRAMSDIVLLTQAGYLTVKGRRGKNLLVSYPNREVACAMAALYAENLFQSEKAEELAGLISECAESGDAARIMEELNRAFLAFNCMAYPVRSEAVCQGLVQLFFRGAGLYAAAETAGALGRSDIEFDAGRLHWVFELKFQGAAVAEGRAAELLEAAKSQIALRRYGAGSRKGLVRVVAVFSEKERRFTRWEQV